jgi:hypothetical protein
MAAYEHRVLAAVGDKLVPMPINRTTLNHALRLDLQTRKQRSFSSEDRGPSRPRSSAPRRMWSSQPIGTRALRDVFPRLHAQAMGHGPIRTRQIRDRPRADAHERPTIATSPTASRRCRPKVTRDVRADARSSEHRCAAGRRLTLKGTRSEYPHRPARLHRADRRIFRLPLWQTALSFAALSA